MKFHACSAEGDRADDIIPNFISLQTVSVEFRSDSTGTRQVSTHKTSNIIACEVRFEELSDKNL